MEANVKSGGQAAVELAAAVCRAEVVEQGMTAREEELKTAGFGKSTAHSDASSSP